MIRDRGDWGPMPKAGAISALGRLRSRCLMRWTQARLQLSIACSSLAIARSWSANLMEWAEALQYRIKVF